MPPIPEIPAPMQVARYLYFVTLTPAASAVAGFSPTARRFRPALVLFRKICSSTASRIAAYARKPYPKITCPTTPSSDRTGILWA